MNAVLCGLKYLQEVDVQLRQTRNTLEEGAAKLAEAGVVLKNLENKLAAAGKDLTAMRTRHRELEGEVSDLAVRQKNNEARQMNIKSDNEYAALMKEAGFLAGRINELEDETLDLLDRIERREAEIAGLETAAAEETAAYERLAAETESAGQAGRDQQTKLAARRAAAVSALPPAWLKQYDDIAKARGGLAVSAAAAGLCLACRLGFPPQIFNELQRNEKIMTCPNCGRIIFWRDHPDFLEEPQDQPRP